MTAQTTGTFMTPSATGSFAGFVCSPEEKARFTSFFENSGPSDGFLPGSTAKEIFLKSQLPSDTLGKVWQLADKDATGKFSLNHFVLAMWIIAKIKANVIKEVPSFIPPSLWNSITAETKNGATAALGSPFASPVSVKGTGSRYAAYISDLSDSDKTQYSGLFDSLDTAAKGKLTGTECSTIFLMSKLPGPELAQIWELVDTAKVGTIDKEGFIAAMHLIKRRVGGAPIPSSTPAPSAKPLLDMNTILPSGTMSPSPAPAIPVLPKPKDSDLLRGLSMSPPPMAAATLPGLPAPFQPSGSFGALPTSSSFGTNPLLDIEAKEVSIRQKALQERQLDLQKIQN
ncbi:hypothetical protein HDU91_005388, partial [Kappamyces sp. JEL0680]